MNQSHIFFYHCAILDGFTERGCGLFGAGKDHDTTDILIQPVDGEELAPQLLSQGCGNIMLRIQPYGFDENGDLLIGIENLHGVLLWKKR